MTTLSCAQCSHRWEVSTQFHAGEALCPNCGAAVPITSRAAAATFVASSSRNTERFIANPSAQLGTLGGYRLLAVLGEGGMGIVYRAEDQALHRQVALKVMRPEVAGSATARERFLREARAGAALDHQHIIPIWQVGEDRGIPFIVMPLLQGETLSTRLKREPAK